MEIKNLTTEQRNPASIHIDTVSTVEMVKIMNEEDQKVALAVGNQDEQIARAIDEAANRYKKGGRLIYLGAGTSGRLGVLDAAELVPTYGIKPERAIGLIAGGPGAMYKAVVGAEDLKDLNLNSQDIVLGLAASGRTPYVIGGLEYANQIGAFTISIACVKDSEIGKHAEVAIEAVVGPEIVTGSTRMKSGTAQKMILNMISTGVMIRQGKVFENVMIDVMPTNSKLVDRASRIISAVTDATQEEALQTLKKAENNVPLAITMIKTESNKDEAQKLLEQYNGNVSEVIKNN